MKWFVLLVLFCLGCFTVNAAELSKKQMKRITKNIKIAYVKDKTSREKTGKFEVLSIVTAQNSDLTFDFEIRVAVELTDKSGQTYLVELSKSQGAVSSDYIGEDEWEFRVAHADLEKLEISAYVIRYGLLMNDDFITVAEEADEVDDLVELKARVPSGVLTQEPVILHRYGWKSPDKNSQSDWE